MTSDGPIRADRYHRRIKMSERTRAERGSPGQAGFSLVELVAVGTVAALLIALAQPSLATARRQSKSAVCLERLGAIGAATAVYTADDPNGMSLPVHPLFFDQDPNNPSFIGAYEWGGKSGIGRQGFVPGHPSTGANAWRSSKYGTAAGFGPPTRPLNRILYPHGFRNAISSAGGFNVIRAGNDTQLQLDAVRCPADDRPPPAAHCPDWVNNSARSSFDHFGTSYYASLFNVSSGNGGQVNSNSPFLRPVSRVPAPARTLAYDENIGRWAWASRRMDCDFLDGIDPGPTKAIPGWHGKNWTFNRAFVDGHSATQAVILEGTRDADGYFAHFRVELVFPNDPDAQDLNRCIIVRGDGWQLDTLPAAPIPTGLSWSGGDRVSFENCVFGE